MSELDEFWDEYVNWAKPASAKVDSIQEHRDETVDFMRFAGYTEIEMLQERVAFLETVIFKLLKRLYG